MAEPRPSWDQTFFALTEIWALRSTCPRLHVGAVIVNPANIVLCSGYNGAVRNAPHCSEIGCLMVDGHCARATHSEVNAIAQAARIGVAVEGGTIYVNEQPCLNCANAIIQSGLAIVRLKGSYGDPTNFQEVLKKFQTSGIKVYRHDVDGSKETRLV